MYERSFYWARMCDIPNWSYSDIYQWVSMKITVFSMETPCWSPSEVHSMLCLVKIPTVGPQKLVKSDQISPGVRSIYIEKEYWKVVFLCKYKSLFLLLFKTAVFQGFTKALKAALLQFQDGRCSGSPFHKWDAIFATHFSLLKKIGNYVNIHPAWNTEPLLPNIPCIPLHYQVDPSIFRKI